METDNNFSLEVRPIVLQSVVENGEATITQVEATSLDLHVLNVNNYNNTLVEEESNIQVSINEHDAVLLSIAMLNPADVIVGSTAFQNLGMDFGSGLTKTYRKRFVISELDAPASNENYGLAPAPISGGLFSSMKISMRNGFDVDGYSQDLTLNLKTDTLPHLAFMGNVKAILRAPANTYNYENPLTGEMEVDGVWLYDGDLVLLENPQPGYSEVVTVRASSVWESMSMHFQENQAPSFCNVVYGNNAGKWVFNPTTYTWSQLTEEFYFAPAAKTFEGFDVKVAFNDGFALNDVRWVEFVSRNDGIIIAPKVTDLTAPVDGVDAVNLDYLNQQVALQEQSDAAVLDYLAQKEQELLPLIENQDSFFGTATDRWYETRVVTVQDGYLSFPDVTKLSFKSSFLGLVKPNPAIDESGMTPEEIAASYRRRVFTDGIVRNAMQSVENYYNDRTDLYLAANGQISDQPPSRGRIIKVGQRSGNDIIVAIEDRGFVTGTQVKRKFYQFGDLTPSPRPDSPEPPPPPPGDLVTQGLLVNLDASDSLSYPGSGSQWTDTAGGLVLDINNPFSYNSGAVRFNGQGASSNTSFTMDLTSGFTMECALKVANHNQGEDVVFAFNGGTGGYMNLLITFSDSGKAMRWEIAGGQSILQQNYNITTGEWLHYVATFDPATGTAKLYMNGSLVQSGQLFCPDSSRTSLVELGRRSDENWSSFDGDIAAARIYNRPLTDAEVLQNYGFVYPKLA